MKEDCSKEVKDIVKKYKKENVKFRKSESLLLSRAKTTKENVEKDIFECKNLEFTEKQVRHGETRYVMFFTYSNKSGRVYVINPAGNLDIITMYPLGKKTLRKYRKKRFK